MSKRIAPEKLEQEESKKAKSPVVTLQSVLGEIFEPDPATDSLEPPAKEEEIKQLEEKLELTLPESYKKLLRFCNGGQLRKRFFKLEDGSYAAISYISGIYDDEGSVLQSKDICEDLGIGSGYAILCGSGPEFFALNFNSDAKDPEVISILQEDDGIKTTQIAKNLETFLIGLEFREEDCLVISIKSTVPIAELEATVIAKLKEAGVDIKSEEEIMNMRANFFANEFGSGSEDDDDDDDDDDSDDIEGGDVVPTDIGARTNAVGDLGGSSDSDSAGDGDSDDDSQEGDANAIFNFGGFDAADFGDDDSSMEEELNKHLSLEPLEPKEYPAEAKLGFNILFTYGEKKKEKTTNN